MDKEEIKIGLALFASTVILLSIGCLVTAPILFALFPSGTTYGP